MTENKKMNEDHSYKDFPVEIIGMKDLTSDTRYFKVRCLSEDMKKSFNYKPGQFVLFSIPGVGEATFSISSPPTRRDFVEFGMRRVGTFTEAFFKLKEGDIFHMRGPYGNGFDMDSLKGRDLIIVAGGLGAVPLRSVLLYAEDRREDFNQVYFLNGARSPDDMFFREDFMAMAALGILDTRLAVDEDPTGKWPYDVGFVTTLIPQLAGKINPENTTALICGPPVM